jgi:hypothetical protein
LVEEDRSQRYGGRNSKDARKLTPTREPAARRVGNVALVAGKRHCYKRQWILRQLVCPRLPGAGGSVRIALGRPGVNGAAVPYAIGAKFAFPDRPVIALVGDGAMQMNTWPS